MNKLIKKDTSWDQTDQRNTYPDYYYFGIIDTYYGCVQYTKWWDLFSDPAYARASVHRVSLYY